MDKKVLSEIKQFTRASNSRVKVFFTLDEIDSSYDSDDDDESLVFRLFGDTFLHVEHEVEELNNPKVGDRYCYKYCPAPYQIIRIGSLSDYFSIKLSRCKNSEEQKSIEEHVYSLRTQDVTCWVSLKLMPMDDDTADDDSEFKPVQSKKRNSKNKISARDAAELIAKQYGNQWRYDSKLKIWQQWNGESWNKVHKEVCIHFIYHALEKMPNVNYGTFSFLENTVKFFKMEVWDK